MPTLETPPNATPPSPQPVKVVRSARYGDLEEYEVLHLLDAMDDERARARFREALYISSIFCMFVAWFLLYGPQVIFHQPKLINPADVLKQRELTYLNMPVDTPKPLPKKPTNNISDQNRTQQTPKPVLDQKTLEQLRREEPAPQPPAPEPPQQQQAQQPPAPPPPPLHPQPQQQAMVDAPPPHPAPARPDFGSSQSAGDAILQAARRSLATGGDYGSAPSSRSNLNLGGAEILSDTMGVDFNPYLRRILSDIYKTWIPLIPEEARPPLSKQGETQLRFIILPDGQIGGVFYENSTHDEAYDRAAWGSITGVGQFPPLPKEFKGPNLTLRIRYLVNIKPSEE
ncbi:MAG: TonB C-terminal domain-containing protein [Acidobacteriaceae bacterium]|nr:TonB C-terminal domain-containing protein [Acidobacteriaceae bacterium]